MSSPHSDQALELLARALGERLLAQGGWFAVAESCTGGWVAKACTDIAGSSGWFDRGFVTYSNEAKQEMLGVSPDTLRDQGAVSEPVVREMALGLLGRSRASVAVAISGIAGPGGGSEEKPVGTVCFGWAVPAGESGSRIERFDGDREAVRRASVAYALRLALERL